MDHYIEMRRYFLSLHSVR